MDGCVFCKKIKEGSVEKAEFKYPPIYHFEPLNPVVPGHRLFIPSKHYARADVVPVITGAIFAEAASWARRQGEDFNLIVNGGPNAGQTVFHLHVHYVPRREGDGLLLPWGGVK